MIKKYEIINDGGKKRIKALRSFHVQGRYVNIGDVGGIVYDENTLSQEGNCWIFSGNLNYPSIRVSGDSIVDTNGYEADVTDPRPFVNVTGTSALIGAHDFVTGATAAKTLAVSDVEQGSATLISGSTYEASKVVDANVIRLRSLLYTGHVSGQVSATGSGYEVRVLRYDENKKLLGSSPWGASASLAVTSTYVAVLVRKTPDAATVPADITDAKVTIPALSVEAYIDINDSRIEFRYTGAMTVATKVNPSSASSTAAGLKSSVSASTLTINKSGDGKGIMWIFADIDHCNVTVSGLTTLSIITGAFKNVKRLLLDGTLAWGDPSAAVRAVFNFTDCDTVAYTNGTFPTTTITTAVSANAPIIFTRCNVPNGIFYHNAKVKNVYTDIDFAKASADLGKIISGTGYLLVSSEVEGMYRIYDTVSKTHGCLVEAYDSIKDADFSDLATMVATTIYKDAKLTGLFNISGTNVFGGTGNHGGGKGCEITNTKETEMVISGNVRVEGNAKVKDTRIAGTGYFGGNSVTENAYIFGSAYVTDNGVFSPAPEEGKFDSDIHIEDNAKFLATSRAGNTVVYMCGDSEFSGTIAFNTISLAMYGKSRIAGKVSGRGVLILEDNADTSDKNVGAYGCIRLVGNYRQTKEKVWTGRRTIGSENAPEYDDNVKTQYDF